jgi:hypothetical protein
VSDIEKARRLFQDAGLAFPAIPEELAVQLKERDHWLFSTRQIDTWTYDLWHYVDEARGLGVEDYAVLSHAGHGVNSYAIQYYLVHGFLQMFLHLGWGGAYMDAEATAARIRDCFSLADQVVKATQGMPGFRAGERLTVVGSDFYGGYWLPPRGSLCEKDPGPNGPLEVLTEALEWLTSCR